MRTFFKGALVGGIGAAAVLATTAALAGTGIGAIFNLGQSNTVDGGTGLSGTSPNGQLGVANASAAAGAYAIGVSGNSPTAGAIAAQNIGGGPALGLAVGNGVPPLAVNSTAKVANLNADQLDGKEAAAFAQAPSDLAGRPCTAFGDPGTTYVSFDTNTRTSDTGAQNVTLSCIYADSYEQNDTKATSSAPLHTSCQTPNPCSYSGSIYPANDDDWYVFNAMKLKSIGFGQGFAALSAGESMDIYRDNVLVASNDQYWAPVVADTSTHTYHVRAHGALGAYRFALTGSP